MAIASQTAGAIVGGAAVVGAAVVGAAVVGATDPPQALGAAIID